MSNVTADVPPAAIHGYCPPTGKRRTLFISVATILTAISIVLITLAYYTVKAHAFYRESARTSGWEGTSYVRDDPELGYVPLENAWMRHRLPPIFTVVTDDRGARVAERGQKSPSKVDVLAVGCSFTWGHGVEEPQTYARVLASRTELTVGNVALASYGTPAVLLSMKRFADLRPKIVIYGYIDHHKLRSICPAADSVCPFVRPTPFVDFDEQDRPYLHGPIGDSAQHNQYLREVVLDHPFGARDVYWAMYRDYLAVTRPATVRYSADDPRILPKMDNYAVWSKEPGRLQRVLDYLIAEMTAQARRVDAKLLVVHLPTVDRWSPAPADLQQAVAAAGATDTLFLVDAYPALKAFADEHGLDSIFIPNDGHPTAAGHARIAETIEPVLRKLTAR